MRKTTLLHRFMIGAVSLIVAAGSVQAQYKEYQDSSTRELMFSLLFDEDFFGYSFTQDGEQNRFLWNHEAVKVRGQAVIVEGETILDGSGLNAGGRTFRFDDVTDIRVTRSGGYNVISFYTRGTDSERATRIRRGNIINPHQTVVIDEDEFIRGTVFSVNEDIEVFGEVNKDVISLFGDIVIGDDAVVRGDVVTVTGRIDLAGNAAVYGSIRSGTDTRLGRRHRYHRFRQTYTAYFDVDFDGGFTRYNRVDGLSLGLMHKFADPDSILPSAWAGGGYAFESRRWRYELGIEQTVLRHPALALGGRTSRLLASDDDWLLSNDENSAFALVAGEDYKDYYESEQAQAYVRMKPVQDLVIESGFHYEETKWLEAERDLWSLFGGEQTFSPNFARVDSAARAAGILEIDTGTNYSLYGHVSYDARDKDEPYYYPGWAAEAVLEWSSPDLDSDFDYTRYRLSVTRYQKLHRRIMLIVRGVYGGSEGYLPMHKRYYLGGLGTMYGYKHKEFSGDHFWLANFEYRVDFPRSDLAASLMWDVGQIGESGSFDNAEVKHSLGVALYIGSDFKIGLAKRLDRSYDDKPRLFARLTFSI